MPTSTVQTQTKTKVLTDQVYESPVDSHQVAFRKRYLLPAGVIFAVFFLVVLFD